jgi:hypothetical protein
MVINPTEALRHAVFSVFRNMGAAIRISWPWAIILTLVAAVLVYFVLRSGYGQTPLEPERGAGTLVLAALIGLGVFSAAFASIAVNWHRYILLDEIASGNDRLRLDRRVLRYAGRMYLAGLITLAIIIAPYVVISSLLFGIYSPEELQAARLFSREWFALTLFQGVFATCAGAILFRFALCLPAAALGKFEIGIFESFSRTQGNTWPLAVIAAGSFGLQIAAQVAVEGLAVLMAALDTAIGYGGLVAVSVIVSWFFTMFGITMLTSLYGFFVENRKL